MLTEFHVLASLQLKRFSILIQNHLLPEQLIHIMMVIAVNHGTKEERRRRGPDDNEEALAAQRLYDLLSQHLDQAGLITKCKAGLKDLTRFSLLNVVRTIFKCCILWYMSTVSFHEPQLL